LDFLLVSRKPVSSLCRTPTKSLMRWSMDHLAPPNSLYNPALKNPLFQHVAQVLFFHHRGLFCAEAWKEIPQIRMIPSRLSP
jgi:hypothetical protein